jgi:lipopolysaccharide biosynthesis protein
MIHPIAFYLPQFHPIPENDTWWGKGFTEWTNVTKAKPQFKGHYQPHLPTDLGFYDLRLGEARMAQADLAKAYGIHGFCYYHYWFNGKRLLDQPLDNMISSGSPDFPFMVCWANENWTRRWDGQDQEILIKQEYSAQDDLEHIRFLCEHFFSDPRYIRVKGKPFILIYRPSLFPDIKRTLKDWRSEASRLGFELYIGFSQGFQFKDDFAAEGFDAAVEFQPTYSKMEEAVEPIPLGDQLQHRFKMRDSIYYSGKVISYASYAKKMIREQQIAPNIFPGITPMWDNTARNKDRALIFKGSTPELYQEWLSSIVKKYRANPQEEEFIFINAWNEWAEGNHLEPCRQWGRAYLEATKKGLQGQ